MLQNEAQVPLIVVQVKESLYIQSGLSPQGLLQVTYFIGHSPYLALACSYTDPMALYLVGH